MLDLEKKIIVSRITPTGSGAILGIRASGLGVLELASNFIFPASKKPLTDYPGNTAVYAVIKDQNSRIVDTVICMVFLAPYSFTGLDVLEVFCHNNRLILDDIINLFLQHGSRLAQPGEFSRQAFENGKIDLMQAEAIHEIVAAQSHQALNRALGQLQGKLSSFINTVTEALFSLLVVLEASFDFAEEEALDIDLKRRIEEAFDVLKESSLVLKQCSLAQNHIRNGIRIVLAGSVNSGKSTIINKLVGKDRAIVSDIAGTTRDVIDVSLFRNGQLINFVDTAGIRDSLDPIEQMGIAKSKQELALADMVVFVVDGSIGVNKDLAAIFKETVSLTHGEVICIFNKSDLGTDSSCQQFASDNQLFFLEISAKQGQGFDRFNEVIDQKITTFFNQINSSPYLLSQRQAEIVKDIYFMVESLDKTYRQGIAPELLATEVRAILAKFSDFSGKNLNEEVLTRIFSSFCIGK